MEIGFTKRTVEIFAHKDGRVFNITDIRLWLATGAKSVEKCGFLMKDANRMISEHDWDANAEDRMLAIYKLITDTKEVPPLLCAKLVAPGAVDIIDGWHTFATLHTFAVQLKLPMVIVPIYLVEYSELKPFQLHGRNKEAFRTPPAGAR